MAIISGNGNLFGTIFSDDIYGGNGNDNLFGGAGQDLLSGSGGADGLWGDGGNDLLFGGNGDDYLDGGAESDWMEGGIGDDIYVVDSLGDVVYEAAAGGIDAVFASVDYALPDFVEELFLEGSAAINGFGNAGDNLLVGNSRNNILAGGLGDDGLFGEGGDDILDGGEGADWLEGGAGDDTYVVESIGDVVFEAAGEGVDGVFASVDYVLPDFVEGLILEGSADINGFGNAGDNLLVGNGWNNVLVGWLGDDGLFGEGGDDILDGGEGEDWLEGGAGDDTYVVDSIGDVVFEAAGEGVDGVLAFVGFTLPDFVEILHLGGAADIDGEGNAGDNLLRGNDGRNVLLGRLGDDELFGEGGDDILDGGEGADWLEGGAGDDTYVVDHLGDVILEEAAGGIDAIAAIISLTLPENVELLKLAGFASIAGFGNAADNVIDGNDGNNVLAGGLGSDVLFGHAGDDTLDGGDGDDRLEGGTGDDVYFVNSVGDSVFEAGEEGTDRIESSVTHRLGANIEHLTLTGADAIDGTGNTLANLLIGNAAANLLNGAASEDRMLGGLGNDTYLVDTAGDRVEESAGHGIDLVRSSASYILANNVENLTLTGTAAINGTGNTLTNEILGNAGNNVLDGGSGNDVLNGGAGADRLIGGAGRDRFSGGSGADDFVFRTAGEAGVGRLRDVLEDFARGADTIDVSSVDAHIGRRGDQDFTFIGTQSFSGTASELRFKSGVLSGDTDGDGAADFQIALTDITKLGVGDLLL